jgi:hypothetical protein
METTLLEVPSILLVGAGCSDLCKLVCSPYLYTCQVTGIQLKMIRNYVTDIAKFCSFTDVQLLKHVLCTCQPCEPASTTAIPLFQLQ